MRSTETAPSEEYPHSEMDPLAEPDSEDNVYLSRYKSAGE